MKRHAPMSSPDGSVPASLEPQASPPTVLGSLKRLRTASKVLSAPSASHDTDELDEPGLSSADPRLSGIASPADSSGTGIGGGGAGAGAGAGAGLDGASVASFGSRRKSVPRQLSVACADTTETFADKVIKFTNCRIVRHHKLLREDVWVRDGRIIDPMERFWDARADSEFSCDEIIDCHNLIIAPGFLDIQINGAFGVDFSNVAITKEEVDKVAKGLLAHGVTAFCPTIVSSSPEVYREVTQKIRPRDGTAETGATILGLHLEGPFICKTKKGAHDEDVIAAPAKGGASLEERYGDLASTRIVTLAPELPGALDAIGRLSSVGIVASMGHSSATAEQADLGFARGATLITHLFNAMGSFHHRDPGLIGLLGRRDGATRCHGAAPLNARRDARASPDDRTKAQYKAHARPPLLVRRDGMPPDEANDEYDAMVGNPLSLHHQQYHHHPPPPPHSRAHRVYYSLIVDGIHCHRYSASMAHRLHPAGLVLVTDAMAAMGLPCGRHNLGSMEVDIFDGKAGGGSYDGVHAVIAGTKTLAGALLPLDGCVRNLYAFTGCTRVQAIEAATLHPAQALGVRGSHGSLEIGARADLVLLDDDLRVRQTFVAGRMAYNADPDGCGVGGGVGGGK